jgi:GTP-binding protein Era
MIESFRSGFVTILGKPNVGKSTLMNILVGEKLSITSSKPQTTRLSVKGIYNDTEKQIIFLDTPGYLKPRYELQKKCLSNFLTHLMTQMSYFL